jgi:tRNA(Ile)-lysidine synthase
MDIRKTVRLAPGQYIVAVSGGVDSVVLLDILRQLPGLRLTVAHYDHGIRPDSRADRTLVAELANQYGLPFVYDEGRLGANTSEDMARRARYAFLRKIQEQTGARGIITAHHLDDVLETATHNILRGTGRKGMTSLKSVDGIIRPLLHLPKSHVLQYARDNQLKWREDSTNQDLRYRRNYIRHKLLPALQAASPEKFELLKQLVRRQHELNKAIDTDLGTVLHVQPDLQTLRRYDVVRLPHAVARELVGEWLRRNGKRQFGRGHLERATIAIKTARPGTTMALDKSYKLAFDKKHARIVNM